LTDTFFASVEFTKHWAANLAIKTLKARGDRTIGLVGTGLMSAAFSELLKGGTIPNARFVDATTMIDLIKAIKSPEERDFIKRTAAMQDAAFAEVLKVVKPGMRDFEVTAAATYASEIRGSEDGLYKGSSAPFGVPTGLLRRPHFQGRQIAQGDYYTLMIENNGPGGFYTELGRTIAFGKAPQQLIDEVGLLAEAQRNTLRLLKPGASCGDIWRAHSEFMAARKRPRESRLYSHGQGYDVMERPLVREEETMTIAEGMNFAVHPGHATDSFYVFLCNNFLIGPEGPGESLHRTPPKVFEV
jgi:Xaa-Pro aminopeptidase